MTHKYFKAGCVIALLFASLSSNAQLMKVSAGTQMVNNGTIVMEGHFINDGTFKNGNGANVIFKGTAEQWVQGSGTTQFYGFEINKPSNNILVQSNIKVAGPLKFTKGSLDLTSNSIQLMYPDGLLQNETEQNRIFATGNGFVVIEQTLNAPTNINPGNLGLTITSQNNLGNTTVYRGHNRQAKANGDLSINRYYHVEPAVNQNISASIYFKYFEAELNGAPESGMKFHQKIGAAEWQAIPVNGSNTQDNIIDVIGVSSLHKYTLFPAVQSPLPLQLLAFNAQCKNNNALLQWITANEVNTKDFTVEKSTDGITWQPAGVLGAKQNTTQQTYTHSVALDNAQFYRLKMADVDGSFTYSPVKKLSCDTKSQVTVGPNPTSGQLKVAMQMAKKDNIIMTVTDAKGSTVFNQSISVTEGLNVHIIDLTAKASGMYLVKLWSANGVNETHRIVKK